MRGLLFIALLVMLNALVSGAEVAIKNVNEGNVRKKALEGDKRAERLVKLLETPSHYINVIEILITLASLLIGMTYSFSHYRRIETWILDVLFSGNLDVNVNLVMTIFTIIITYFIVLFGILLPKKIALKYANICAFFFSGVLVFFGRLFFPFIWLLEKNTNGILRLFHINPNDLEENVTEEEIISIVNEGHEQGILEADEAEMISNIINFDEKTADDIMTHRKKIVAINSELTIEEALRFMLTESFSRFPIYESNIDNIIGILHLKDVMSYYVDPKLRNQPLTKIAREPYFIPDTQTIDVLFHDMQLKKIHMAIAIDEYGQTAGLVAMEDILEEIVGDILDEYDVEEELILILEDGFYLIRGDIGLEELEDFIDIEFLDEDLENYGTINGLLISKLDHIPSIDEKAIVEYGEYKFEIVEVRDNMIHLVKAIKTTPEVIVDNDNLSEQDNGNSDTNE